jgi:hypothetical protein
VRGDFAEALKRILAIPLKTAWFMSRSERLRVREPGKRLSQAGRRFDAEGRSQHLLQIIRAGDYAVFWRPFGWAAHERAVQQADTPVWQKALQHQVVPEARVWMGGCEPIGNFYIDGELGLRGEVVCVPPSGAAPRLEEIGHPRAAQAQRSARHGLLWTDCLACECAGCGGRPWHGGSGEKAAEANIGDVGYALALALDLQNHMSAWVGRSAGSGCPDHAGGERRNGETYGLKHEFQQRILLEAVAAALSGDEFGLQLAGIERDREPEERVQVFKRDRRWMAGVDRAERWQAGLPWSGVTDAGEIGVEV